MPSTTDEIMIVTKQVEADFDELTSRLHEASPGVQEVLDVYAALAGPIDTTTAVNEIGASYPIFTASNTSGDFVAQ